MNVSALQISYRRFTAVALIAGIALAAPNAFAEAPMAPSKKGVAATISSKAAASDVAKAQLDEAIRKASDDAAIAASVRQTEEPYGRNVHPFYSQEPFPYVAIRQPIGDVLQAFRIGLGMPVLGNTEADTLVSVDGTNMTPRQFLSAATSQAGLQWYFDGMSLHIVGTDKMKSRLIELGDVSVDELRVSLDQLQLNDPRFEISVSPGANIAKVQGPEPFVEAVGSLLQTLRNRKPVIESTPQKQRAASTRTVELQYSASQPSSSVPRVFRGQARSKK